MKLAYRFEGSDSLYVNVVEWYECVNKCLSCARPLRGSGEHMFERMAGGSLFVPYAVNYTEVMSAIEGEIRPDEEEVAFVGLGEPLLKLGLVATVAEGVKRRYDVTTRVDTSGVVGTWGMDALTKEVSHPVDVLVEAGVDEVRVSVNATNLDAYDWFCRPSYTDAFDLMQEFVRRAVASPLEVSVSFVTGFDDRLGDEDAMRSFARDLGVVEDDHVILREFVEPIVL